MNKISVVDKFSSFNEQWTPKIIAEANGQLIKLAKGSGQMVWHSHENEDELFLVYKGQLTLQFRDKKIVLNPGEMVVVPRGVEHCPIAETDTHFMLIEPASTEHTGKQKTDITIAVKEQEWI